MDDVVGHLSGKSGRNEDLLDMMPLQITDEGIRLNHNLSKQV